MPSNPALLRHTQERAENVENRVADAITRFAGSMPFVYIHVIWFAARHLVGDVRNRAGGRVERQMPDDGRQPDRTRVGRMGTAIPGHLRIQASVGP